MKIKVELNDYKACKSMVVSTYEKSDIEGMELICVLISCPIIAGCYYCAQELGMNDELQDLIQSLTKFYSYDKIEWE